jgi:hypothetical protein
MLGHAFATLQKAAVDDAVVLLMAVDDVALLLFSRREVAMMLCAYIWRLTILCLCVVR